MADRVSNIQEWSPSLVVPTIAPINQLGMGIGSISSVVSGLATTAAGLLRAAKVLVPSVDDPSLTLLNTSLGQLTGVLNTINPQVDADLNMLIIPPVIGGVNGFFNELTRKLNDSNDPRRATSAAGTKSAGFVFYLRSTEPNEMVSVYKSIQNLLGTSRKRLSNAVGFNLQRPEFTLDVVSGKPRLSWEYPHPYDLAQGRLRVRGAAGGAIGTILEVADVAIWRRQKPSKGGEETKLVSIDPRTEVNAYVDDSVSEGKYEYAVAFDYILSDGKRLDGVRGNWQPLNLTRKATKKSGSGGGSFPRFQTLQPAQAIAGLNEVTGKINQFTQTLSDRTTNFSKQIDDFAKFLDDYVVALTQELNSIIDQLNKITKNLEAIANASASFATYEGAPAGCIEALASQAGQDQSELVTGVFVNATTNAQATATAAVSGLQAFLGFGGNLRPVDDLAKTAQAIKRSGALLVDKSKANVVRDLFE